MKKFLLGMTAAAALAVAVPGMALAQQGGDHGGGGKGGASMSGGGGGGGHISGGGSARSSGSVRGGGNAHISSRANIRGDVRGHSRGHVSSREFSHRDRVRGDVRTRDRYASRDYRHDGRRHHHRHFRDRNFSFFVDTPDYYDNYAYYDPCYRNVWTSFGWRYVNTCTSYYYGVY
jgi:hypothetical protein